MSPLRWMRHIERRLLRVLRRQRDLTRRVRALQRMVPAIESCPNCRRAMPRSEMRDTRWGQLCDECARGWAEAAALLRRGRERERAMGSEGRWHTRDRS